MRLVVFVVAVTLLGCTESNSYDSRARAVCEARPAWRYMSTTGRNLWYCVKADSVVQSDSLLVKR